MTHPLPFVHGQAVDGEIRLYLTEIDGDSDPVQLSAVDRLDFEGAPTLFFESMRADKKAARYEIHHTFRNKDSGVSVRLRTAAYYFSEKELTETEFKEPVVAKKILAKYEPHAEQLVKSLVRCMGWGRQKDR